MEFSDLDYEFSLKPHDDPALADFVIVFRGMIKAWDDTQADEVTIGEISGYRINFSVLAHAGLAIAELLERISQEVAEFADIAELICDTGAPGCHCMIYLSEISIEPRYRDQGLGSDLIGRLPKMMDVRDCVIALKAFPISYDYGASSSTKAIHKVKRFYQRLGFEHVGRDYMSKNCTPFV